MDDEGHYHYDAYGNIVTTGEAQPGFADVIFGSGNNDRLSGGNGNDGISGNVGDDENTVAEKDSSHASFIMENFITDDWTRGAANQTHWTMAA